MKKKTRQKLAGLGVVIILLIIIGYGLYSAYAPTFNPEDSICDEFKVRYETSTLLSPVMPAQKSSECVKWHPKTPCEKGDNDWKLGYPKIEYDCECGKLGFLGFNFTEKMYVADINYFVSRIDNGSIICYHNQCVYNKTVCYKKSECELNPRDDEDCRCVEWKKGEEISKYAVLETRWKCCEYNTNDCKEFTSTVKIPYNKIAFPYPHPNPAPGDWYCKMLNDSYLPDVAEFGEYNTTECIKAEERK